jgi:hypothetical protein
MALHGGSKTLFFDSLSKEPIIPYPDLNSLLNLQDYIGVDNRCNTIGVFEDIDNELTEAWRSVSSFCTLIDIVSTTKQLISTETFLDAMVSVMYRLVRMQFESGSVGKLIGLGLISFSCNIFLHRRHVGASYRHLADSLKSSLEEIALSRATSPLAIWVLVIGAITVFEDIDNNWIKPTLLRNMAVCEVDSWNKMQSLLKSFLWIESVHDGPGKTVYLSLIGSMNR